MGIAKVAAPSKRTDGLAAQVRFWADWLQEQKETAPDVESILALLFRTAGPFSPSARDNFTVPEVVEVLSDVMRVTLPDLRSRCRLQHVVFCRQYAMYIARQLTAESFPAIGAYFQHHHSTVIYACQLIGARAARDADFATAIERMKRLIRELKMAA